MQAAPIPACAEERMREAKTGLAAVMLAQKVHQ
jgi:hypothetical protein